jgi:Tfp pilus assembly protein PilO
MRNRQPLIAAVAGLGLAVLIIAVLILPKVSQVRARQKQVAQAQAQGQQLRLQLQQLQALAKQAPAERAKLAALRAAVPPTVDLPGLIRLLNGAAEQSGVDFTSLSPGQPAPGTDTRVSVIPVSITVGGTFFAVDQYMIQLETLPRAIKVLSIAVAPGGTSELQVTLSANFFTTDTSAGPGSAPGPTGPAGAPAPSASPTASPGASPSGTPSPTASGPFSPTPAGSPTTSPTLGPTVSPSTSPTPGG